MALLINPPGDSHSKSRESRLFIQYNAEDTQFDMNRVPNMENRQFSVIETQAFPLKKFILPRTLSIQEALKVHGVSTENVLNIIIEGGTYELQQLLKFYDSTPWNEISYLEDTCLYHQIQRDSIKQATKSRDKRKYTIVSSIFFSDIRHLRSQSFYGLPKQSSKYTLQVRFKKSSAYGTQTPEAGMEQFHFKEIPLSCCILELDMIAQKGGFSEPAIEFFFKSDDLLELNELKSEYLNLKLPSKKCNCRNFHLYIEPDCIEPIQKSPQTDKYIVNFGTYSTRLTPNLCYR